MLKIFMTLALIGCGLTWLGAAKSAHNQEDLRARRLVIEDKEGRARLTVGTDDKGDAVITMNDRLQKRVAEIKGFETGARITLFDANGIAVVNLGSGASSVLPSVLIRDPTGAQITIGASDSDTPGKPTARPQRWGLFVMDSKPFTEKAGIGMSRDPKRNAYRGFVFSDPE